MLFLGYKEAHFEFMFWISYNYQTFKFNNLLLRAFYKVSLLKLNALDYFFW